MPKIFTLLAVGIFLATPVFAQTNTPTDITKPTISGVTVSGVASTVATVTWTTNEPATSYVDFGPSDIYGNTLGEGQYLTTHSVSVLGLTPSTLYHFRVRSKDAAGNEATSTDTTLTTAAATNTNTAANTNSSNLNTNAVANTNMVKANTNTANKNTNTAKNINTNKNTNRNTNTNANKNVNTNLNTNSSATEDIFNRNTNATIEESTNLNTSVVNSNSASAAVSTSDGRTGILLIALGVLVLIGVVGFAWYKLRHQATPRI